MPEKRRALRLVLCLEIGERSAPVVIVVSPKPLPTPTHYFLENTTEHNTRQLSLFSQVLTLRPLKGSSETHVGGLPTWGWAGCLIYSQKRPQGWAPTFPCPIRLSGPTGPSPLTKTQGTVTRTQTTGGAAASSRRFGGVVAVGHHPLPSYSFRPTNPPPRGPTNGGCAEAHNQKQSWGYNRQLSRSGL